jgi:hypothetical protein
MKQNIIFLPILISANIHMSKSIWRSDFDNLNLGKTDTLLKIENCFSLTNRGLKHTYANLSMNLVTLDIKEMVNWSKLSV